MKSRTDFIASLRSRGLFYVFPGDDGVWHGVDFLWPGDDIGKPIACLPDDAKVCQGCYICYHSKPGEEA